MPGSMSIKRYHDICCGHRVVGHEGKCINFHGHNYRIHFVVAPTRGLDSIGRVLDFSAVKATLCEWLEKNWDHKFLMWDQDPFITAFYDLGGRESIVRVPFNPTAENMAMWLVEELGPRLLGTSVELVEVAIEETRKCSATYHKL